MWKMTEELLWKWETSSEIITIVWSVLLLLPNGDLVESCKSGGGKLAFCKYFQNKCPIIGFLID